MSIVGELINANLAGSFLIIVVILIRSQFLNKIPKKMFMFFWEVVLFRFIFIFKFSFFSMNSVSASPFFNFARNINYDFTFFEKRRHSHFLNFIFFVWITVTFFLLGFVIYTHLKSLKHYKEALPAYSVLVNRILIENHLKKKVQVKKLDTVSSPFVYGFIRPTIIFPVHVNLDCDTTKYILTHEIAHIKNRDIWKKSILTAVASIYWFNPIVWMMFILMNRDMELICDESVIKKYGASHNYIYANLLLHLEEKKGGFHSSYIGIGKIAIKERIEMIMKLTKKSVFCIAISVIIIIITIGFTFGNKIGENAQDIETSVSQNYTKEELELNRKINQAIRESVKESFSEYSKFGLSYDCETDQLYLNNDPIKYFEDNIADDGTFNGSQYQCEGGTEGAYVVYDENKHIQSIKKFSKKELEQHLKKSWK